MERSSRISGFYKMTAEERIKTVKEFAGLSDEDVNVLMKTGALDIEMADRMIENVIGTHELPIGIATNFLINGKDYLIPMCIEEPSVVAAASNAAKMARPGGGFYTDYTGPLMIGQVQVVDVGNPHAAKFDILKHRDDILRIANEQDPVLIKVGGGARDIDVRIIDSLLGTMVVVHLLVDTRDAMGANAVNTMAEAVAPYIEKITGGRVYLRIISNLASYRIARAKAIFKKDVIGGENVVRGIMEAYAFAAADPYRAATHNKGIMNGIVAVALATANDTRALESGAHAYASRNGTYAPLTRYEVSPNGDLIGTIEIPMAVGLIGGATAVHPVAKINVKILGVKDASELAQVMAAVGLAQNFAALRALATEGIQRGHMSLHARNLAIMAGAPRDIVDKVVEIVVKEKKVRFDRIKEIVEKLKKGDAAE